MIYWHEALLLDRETGSDIKKTKKIIRKRYKEVNKRDLKSMLLGKYVPKNNYTLIVLPTNPDNLFDIVDMKNLYFSCYTGQDLYVAGIAKNHDNTINMIKKMFDNNNAFGDGNLISFCDKSRFRADNAGRSA